MRICPSCDCAPREDDPLITAEIPGRGMSWACRDCIAKAAGVPVVIPSYPVGSHIPMVGEGMSRRHLRLCAVCRVALRESDPDGLAIRLRPEDSEDGEELPAGCLICCPECYEGLKPRVYERLVRENILKPDPVTGLVPEMAGLGENWFL